MRRARRAPSALLADLDPVERRQRQVDVAVLDQLAQVAVEERQQQRRDVMAVAVGIDQEEDLAVAQLVLVEVVADAAAERGDDVLELALLSTFSVDACSALSTLPRSGRIACVRRSRPCLAEPPAESPSTMNSSDSSGIGRRAVGELARQVEPVADRRLARHRLRGRARRPRARAPPGRCARRSPRPSSCSRSASSRAPGARRRRPRPATSGLLSRSLVCPWNCGSQDVDARGPRRCLRGCPRR